jgi:hypothetical protein
MAKQRRKAKIKVGDVVAITWDDTVAYGRTTQADEDLILAEFTSYGIVSHLDERRVVLRQESEVTPHPKGVDEMFRTVTEPVLIPFGCITKVIVFRPSGEVTV